MSFTAIDVWDLALTEDVRFDTTFDGIEVWARPAFDQTVPGWVELAPEMKPPFTLRGMLSTTGTLGATFYEACVERAEAYGK